MVVVRKERSHRKKRRPSDKSNGMVPVKDYVQPYLRVVIFGRNRTGKTTLASTFPKPIGFITFAHREGLSSIVNVEGVYCSVITDSDEIYPLLDTLGKYKTVVLDDVTGLEDVLYRELLNLDKAPESMTWGLSGDGTYRERSERFRAYVRKIRELPCNTVILANERDQNARKSDEEIETDEDLSQPFVTAALGEATCKWLYDINDHIMQTFLREKEIVVGRGNIKKTVKSPRKLEFCLRMGPHSYISTGSRALRGTVPTSVIVDPTYEKIQKVLKG